MSHLIKTTYTACLFLIFCGLSNVFAQGDNGTDVPVIDVLKDLEKTFNVSFSFADSALTNVRILPFQGGVLDAHLSSIEQQTLIVFEVLSDRFIAVRYIPDKQVAICGYIKSKKSGNPVSEAIIQSKNEIIFTNEEGFFEIKGIAANDSVLIQRLGYQPRIVNVSSIRRQNCNNIYLTERISQLKQVIITNYLTQGISLGPGGVFSLEAEKFGVLPGLVEPDLLHSIQSLPGIHSFNETISNINIRGGTNDQNLILWNDIRMYQTGHFFGLISAFNPYLSHHVEITKNGTNAAYGRGVSGMINISSDNNIVQEFSGTAGVNMLNGDLLLKIPVSKRSSIQLSGRHSISGLWKTPTYNAYFERAFRDSDLFNPSANTVISDDQFSFYDYSFHYLIDLNETDEIRLNLLNIQNELQYTEAATVGGSLIEKTSSLSQQSRAGGFQFKKQWNSGFNSSFNLYVSRYNLNAINNDISQNQELKQTNEVLDFGAKIEARIILGAQADLSLGYEINDVGVTNEENLSDPNFRSLKTEIVRTHSAFGQMTYESKHSGTLITLGSRASYFDKFGQWRIEPRAAVTQALSPKFSVDLLGELKSQVTTQIIDFQTDFLGIEKRRWVLSNDQDIPIIKSNQLSIGVNYSYQKWLVTLEAYRKNVNAIITSSQGFQNQFQFVRSPGNYLVNGMDFLINRKTDHNSSWISYAIAENTYEFRELQPVTFPNNVDITHSLAGGTSVTYERWSGSAGFNYRTGRPFTSPNPQVETIDGAINYGSPNSQRVGYYLRLDLSLKYHFKVSERTRGQIGVSIWNLADRKNTTSIHYQLDPSEQINRIEQEALGRTINVGMRLNF
ncbi:TonB-dependent receptor plug domain-containing protein [Ekhidna sp.]|uniref:TonB-dependent receptor n=1 Tax=Ekhidna sp. TaxID=2608089 RepID=UPI0032996572